MGKKNKIVAEVVVSIPRAGEFLIKLPLDREKLTRSMNWSPTDEVVEGGVYDKVQDKIKIKITNLKAIVKNLESVDE